MPANNEPVPSQGVQLPLPLSEDWQTWAYALVATLQSEGVGGAGAIALPIYDTSGRIMVGNDGLYAYDAAGGLPISPDIVQIDTEHLVDAAVVTEKIADLAVDTEKLAALAVEAAQLASGAVIAGKIAVNAIVAGDGAIANLAVGTAQIANAAILSGKIGDLEVITAKINDLAVNEGKIANLAVGTGKIQNLAVKTGKIDSLAVTEAKIGALAVTAAKIDDLAVTTAKIDDLSVVQGKIGLLAVGAAQIALLAVGSAQIGALAVETAKIANLNITTGKIANLGVTETSFFSDNGNQTGITTQTAINTFVVAKTEGSGSRLRVDVVVGFRGVTSDIQALIEVERKIATVWTLSTSWQTGSVDGVTATCTFTDIISGLGSGNHDLRITITRQTGAGTITKTGCEVTVTEEKK